jgi:glycerol-3-phosphate dehydrogenase
VGIHSQYVRGVPYPGAENHDVTGVQDHFDVIIIGAGVVGSLVARELSRYRLEILLIDKEPDVGSVTSAANTAIIHAGYNPPSGTLKATLNIAGNRLWEELAAELGFAFERTGDYVVAVGDDELAGLTALLERGRRNGATGMRILTADEVQRREPRISPRVTAALYAPSGGICDPFAVTVAAAENAVLNGVVLKLQTSFLAFVKEGDSIVAVRTSRGTYGCRWAVNAAGLHSDYVMHRAGLRPEFTITPRRGEYHILDKAAFTIGTVLFPVPTEASKGILVSTTTHGNVVVGPNAEEIADREDTDVSSAGLEEIWSGATRLVPDLPEHAIIASFAGVRATGNACCQASGVDYGHDFVVEIPGDVRGFVNLAGIDSPGLTSSPAIAHRVVDLLKDAGERLEERPEWNPVRPRRTRFRDLSRLEQVKLIEKDPRYGRVVCRCETVTEAEVVAEIHAPIPAVTYDAIKRRTWLGTGRCQGAFDMPRVVEIIAREQGISPLEVTKKGPGSELIARHTKHAEAPRGQ